ncbi:DUF4373 domain-containing protein [Clostridium sp. AWRP]|uniref:Lin1244/Lin1753 domain-containing protein n=1 Tax=Clostridium sp. AWRP TaxID=2212991 RepID=UPI001FAADDBE|nr:DUF4373 domain-containing protein [Clostridium sp. AWRP]
MEYFPLDVDMDQDDKVALIEAQHGIVGFGIVIKLLMKIYKHGYFYEWVEKQQLLFSKRVNVDINLINEIINDCVKWGLFDKKVFETYKVLTSKGIQKRYIEAAGRRQKVKLFKEYLLLDDETISVYKNLVIVYIIPNHEVVNVSINLQNKEEKSTEKERKEQKRKYKNENSLYEKTLELCKYYENLKPGESIKKYFDVLKIFVETYGYGWVKEALKITVSNKKRFIKGYMEKILKNWIMEGKEEKGGGIEKNIKSGAYDFSKYSGS